MINVVTAGQQAEAGYEDDPYEIETFPALNALSVNLSAPRYNSDLDE